MRLAAASMFGLATLVACSLALAQDRFENFEATSVGDLPVGWQTGDSGPGTSRWRVITDSSAPSRQHSLVQSHTGTSPWAINSTVKLADGFVETRFRPIAGRTAAAAGIVWRWRDRLTYYVAFADAADNSVSLFHQANGVRTALGSAAAPVRRNAWGTLRAEFQGTRVRVLLDGKPYIEIDDPRLREAGAIGVGTLADSMTGFDDLRWGAR